MEGILILKMEKISVTRMIETGIYGMSRGNNMRGIIRGIDHLKFNPLHLRDL